MWLLRHASQPVMAVPGGWAARPRFRLAPAQRRAPLRPGVSCLSAELKAGKCIFQGLRAQHGLQVRAGEPCVRGQLVDCHAATPAKTGPLSGGQEQQQAAWFVIEGLRIRSELNGTAFPLDVLEHVNQRGHSFNHHLVSTILASIAEYRPDDLRPVLAHPGWEKLLQVVHRHAGVFETGELSIVIAGLGHLEQAPMLLVRDVLHAAAAKLAVFSSHDLSRLLWGMARLNQSCRVDTVPASFLEAVEQRLPTLLPEASAFHIWSFVSAFGSLGHPLSQHVLSQAAERVVQVIDEASPETVKSIVLCFAQMGFEPSGTYMAATMSKLREAGLLPKRS